MDKRAELKTGGRLKVGLMGIDRRAKNGCTMKRHRETGQTVERDTCSALRYSALTRLSSSFLGSRQPRFNSQLWVSKHSYNSNLHNAVKLRTMVVEIESRNFEQMLETNISYAD